MLTLLFGISAGSLILVGIYGVLTKTNVIRILLALNILETGINLLIVALGYFEDGKTPIIQQVVGGGRPLQFVDPLPHALVLTSIVIGLGTTALALGLTIRYYEKQKTLELQPDSASVSGGEIVE
jgi:multisubunit Na+/H+ antiporter MnhC subunit